VKDKKLFGAIIVYQESALVRAIRFKSGTKPTHKSSPCFSLLSRSLSAIEYLL